MRNIFRFMKKAWAIVPLILLLLIGQAWCDLALPGYTSDLLNTGLQSGGIRDAVPETMREETLKLLELFVSEDDAKILNAAYLKQADSAVLILDETADRGALNEMLLIPESVLYQLENAENSPFSIEALMQAVQSGMITRDMIREQLSNGIGQMEGLTDTFLSQVAVQFVSDEYAAQGRDLNQIRRAYLLQVGGKMLLVSLFMTLTSIAAGYLASISSAKIGRDLRSSLYEKVMQFTEAEIERFSTASLITRCTNDVQQVQMVVVMMLRMVAYAPILAIGGIIRVSGTNSGMSWIIVVAVAALFALIIVLVAVAMPKFKIMQTLVDRLNLVSREMLTGIMPIRAFSREAHEERRFDEANRNLYRNQLFTNHVMAFMFPTMMFIMNGISVLIVWVGAQRIDLGRMQIGDLTAFITYSMVIVMGFLMVSMISIILPRAGVAADRIVEVLDCTVSLKDPENPKDLPENVRGEIEFHDVAFSYPGSEEAAIEHISFKAEPGHTTAIIGSTGCGKSTLLNLIPRFYDVTEGSITLDGIDLRDLRQSQLHDCIGYVPQKSMLFAGTIESNLKYSGESVTDEQMKRAAQIAQAESFIESKEEGFASHVAQEGSNLSGGQKQRLSIARAIAKNPRILLFDDSFSALDYKTDLALRTELAEKTADATVIIVAQRISTILHADRIIVLDEGHIAGIGTHEELLAACVTYQEIARSQLSEAELAGVVKGGEC